MVDPIQKTQRDIEACYLPAKIKEGKTVCGLTVKQASKAVSGNALQKLFVRICLLFKEKDKNFIKQLFSFENKIWYNEKKISAALKNLDSISSKKLSTQFKSLDDDQFTNKQLPNFKTKFIKNVSSKPSKKEILFSDEKLLEFIYAPEQLKDFKDALQTFNYLQKANLSVLLDEGVSLPFISRKLKELLYTKEQIQQTLGDLLKDKDLIFKMIFFNANDQGRHEEIENREAEIKGKIQTDILYF